MGTFSLIYIYIICPDFHPLEGIYSTVPSTGYTIYTLVNFNGGSRMAACALYPGQPLHPPCPGLFVRLGSGSGLLLGLFPFPPGMDLNAVDFTPFDA